MFGLLRVWLLFPRYIFIHIYMKSWNPIKYTRPMNEGLTCFLSFVYILVLCVFCSLSFLFSYTFRYFSDKVIEKAVVDDGAVVVSNKFAVEQANKHIASSVFAYYCCYFIRVHESQPENSCTQEKKEEI